MKRKKGPVVTAPDAPQVEPLTLTLEEALAKLGERGYMLGAYGRKGAPEYVLRDVYSLFARGPFGHWKDAVEAVLGVPVVPRDDTADLTTAYMVGFEKGKDAARDDTAELVEAVDTFLSRLEGFLGATTAALEAWENGTGPNIPIPVYSAAAARLATSGGKLRAALARVRGET